MATFQLFFQSGRAKDLSAPLYICTSDICTAEFSYCQFASVSLLPVQFERLLIEPKMANVDFTTLVLLLLLLLLLLLVVVVVLALLLLLLLITTIIIIIIYF